MVIDKREKMPQKNDQPDWYDLTVNNEEIAEDFDIKREENNAPLTSDNNKKKRNRWVYIMVICFGLFVIFLGYYDLWGQIYLPFFSNTNTNDEYQETQQAAMLMLELQTADTDEDGLTDYDELYLQGTSPYLSDSDSDGIKDGEDTDPNCPKGQICGRTSTSNTNVSSATNTNQGATESGELSIDDLKTALIKSGASANEVNNMDEATLLEAYNNIVGQAASNTGTTGTISLSELKNLSADDIRLFLQLGGIDETTLKSLNDNTLKTIFQNSLEDLE